MSMQPRPLGLYNEIIDPAAKTKQIVRKVN